MLFMKRLAFGLMIIIMFSLLSKQEVLAVDPSANSSHVVTVRPDSEMRGLWVASVENLDWPKNLTTSAVSLRKEAIEILDFAKAHRFNAIFLQVRPTSDSFFPSDFFPWSQFLTGSIGLAPQEGFDPLAFWIEEAHKRGLELHAWINPFRITKKLPEAPNVALSSLPATHPARRNPGWVVRNTDGDLYYSPGTPEVREMLIDSIEEILARYPVDGIHFDDFLYPPDAAAFKLHGSAFPNIDDWRRNNINTFVREVSETVRRLAPEARFGISPFGIWQNIGSDPYGSETRGLESYSAHASDTRKWVKMGWVDYIVPQLYWPIGFERADYEVLLKWWSDVVSGTGVELYTGHAAHRMDADDVTSQWYGISEMNRQEILNRSNPEWDGSIYFRYQSFKEKPGLAAALLALREAEDGISTGPGGGYLAMLQNTGTTGIPTPQNASEAASLSSGPGSGGLLVSRPLEDFRTGSAFQFLNGSSNPDKPLYLNGSVVEGRTSEGFFGIFMPLAHGKNTFVVSQEGVYIVRTVWRNHPAPLVPPRLASARIPANSVFPQSPIYGRSGETHSLVATAPIGASVSVRVGGTTLRMVPDTTVLPSTPSDASQGPFSTTFRVRWTMPVQTGNARVVDLGRPVYTMLFRGRTRMRTAPGNISNIMPGAPFYAEVRLNSASVFLGMNVAGGSIHTLGRGSFDSITGIVGQWIRLGSGHFIRDNAVRIHRGGSVLRSSATNAIYAALPVNNEASSYERFSFALSRHSAVTATFDGKFLRVRVPLADALALPTLPAGAMFSSVISEAVEGGLRYVFSLREGARLAGYELIRTGNGFEVVLRRHVASPAGSALPLAGRTILIDPGHGGTMEQFAEGDPGAVGPLGLLWSERNINLSNSFILKDELEKLGASVVMTRTEDVPVTLVNRLEMSRRIRPDLFIAMHADSMPDSSNLTRIAGFSVWHREALAADIGRLILRNVVDNMGRRDRRLNPANFFVVRGTWTPSILVETGFVPNPTEFAQMLNPVLQRQMMSLIAESVATFFTSP